MVITFSPIRNTLHKIKPNSPPRLKVSLKLVRLYLFLKCTHKLEVLCVIITNTKFHGWEISKRASSHTSLKNAQTKYASPLSVLAVILNCITQGPLHRTLQRFCFLGWTLINYMLQLRNCTARPTVTKLTHATAKHHLPQRDDQWDLTLSLRVSNGCRLMMRRRVNSYQLNV